MKPPNITSFWLFRSNVIEAADRLGGATGVWTSVHVAPSKVQVSFKKTPWPAPPKRTIFLLTGSYAMAG